MLYDLGWFLLHVVLCCFLPLAAFKADGWLRAIGQMHLVPFWSVFFFPGPCWCNGVGFPLVVVVCTFDCTFCIPLVFTICVVIKIQFGFSV